MSKATKKSISLAKGFLGVCNSRYKSRSIEAFHEYGLQAQLNVILNGFPEFIHFGLGIYPADEQQLEFVCAVHKALIGEGKPRISVRSGHGTGKTSLLSWVALYIGLKYKNARIIATAPTSGQLRSILMPEIKKWHSAMHPALRLMVEPMTDKVKFQTGNTFIARTAKPENSESIAGIHGEMVVYLVDEASGVDSRIFEVIEGALTGKHLFIMISNPTRNIGFFYDSHHKNADAYKLLHFSSERSKLVDKEWLSLMAKKGKGSDTYRVRVLGEFAKQNTKSLFDCDIIAAAVKRVHADETGASYMGVDVARYNGDDSTIWYRKGRKAKLLDVIRNRDTMELAYAIKEHYMDTKADVVIVDTIGIGIGVYDRLKELGVPVVQGNASSRADKSKSYLNRRAEAYDKLAEWLVEGNIPDDDLLREELLATQYIFSKQGKMQIIDKELIRQEIGRSPDRADGLALTFYHEIIPNVSRISHKDLLPDTGVI